MKYKVAIFLLAIGLCGKSQFNSLFQYFYPEQIRGIVKQDNNLIMLKMTSSYPWFGDTLNNLQVNGSFTKLIKYSFDGQFIEALNFPCNDSIYHYGTRIVINSENKIIVAGDAWYNKTVNASYDPFIAIINSNFQIDSIHYFPTVTQNVSTNNLIATTNGSFGHYTSSILRVYNQNFEQQISYNIGNTGNCKSNYTFHPCFFNFNNNFYTLYNVFNSSDSSGVSLLKFDQSSSNCEVVFTEQNNNNLNLRHNFNSPTFAKTGKKLNDTSFLIHGVTSERYCFVLKVDNSGNVSVFFKDTIDHQLVDFSFSNLEFENNNYIFFAYSSKNDGENGVLLYCIDNQGTLKWKNFYPINEGLEFDGFLPLNHIKALPNNDCIVTIGVKGYMDKSDVYILRVDSNGNVKNFVTSVNSMHSGEIVVIVYPNPANDVLNIGLQSNENFTVEMYNLAGQKVKAATQLHHQTASINIGDFSKGMCFYQIKSESGNLLKAGKFLKE